MATRALKYRWDLVTRLGHRGLSGSLIYFLGRFYAVRQVCRLLNLARAWFQTAPASRLHSQPCVEPFDPAEAIRKLKSESVFAFIRLREPVLKALLDILRSAGRFEAHGLRQELDEGMLVSHARSGDPVLIADCKSTALDDMCAQVANDPQLVDVASRFLGRAPHHVEWRLQESLVAEASVAFRESKNQTVQFHYDVQALNFLYVFFYLTDTDCCSGSHELMRGTHKCKRLRHLMASARAQDEDIYNTYGRDRSWVIEATAGSGFIEDTSCYHRALAPVRRNRLALQLRFS